MDPIKAHDGHMLIHVMCPASHVTCPDIFSLGFAQEYNAPWDLSSNK